MSVLSLILMSLPEAPSSAEIAEVEEQMTDVYEQIGAGSDFREMAIRYSQAPNALEGGALGWLEGEQVPTVFVDVLPTMSAGDVCPSATCSSATVVSLITRTAALAGIAAAPLVQEVLAAAPAGFSRISAREATAAGATMRGSDYSLAIAT